MSPDAAVVRPRDDLRQVHPSELSKSNRFAPFLRVMTRFDHLKCLARDIAANLGRRTISWRGARTERDGYERECEQMSVQTVHSMPAKSLKIVALRPLYHGGDAESVCLIDRHGRREPIGRDPGRARIYDKSDDAGYCCVSTLPPLACARARPFSCCSRAAFGALGVRGLAGRGRAGGGASFGGGAFGLLRQRAFRSRAPRLALQHLFYRARHTWPSGGFAFSLSGFIGVFRALPGALLRFALRGWRKIHASAAGLGQPDSDRLLRRSCSMLALANPLDLLAHELAGLRARRFSLALVFLRSLDRFFARHSGRFPRGVCR